VDVNWTEVSLAEEYVGKIKTMKRGDSNRPHKYLMLLSIVSLIDQNTERQNHFTFDELEPIYLSHFNLHFQSMPDYTKMLEYPFYHLQRDGFWHLKILPNKDEEFRKYETLRLTKKRLLETVMYGYLEDKFFKLLKKSDVRTHLKMEIIKKLQQESKQSSKVYKENTQMTGAMQFNEEKSLFKHEQNAIDIIKAAVTNNKYGHIISNLFLYDKQANNYLEYDVVLVTSWGIFVVELKHWSGNIRIAPYNWVVNDFSYRKDPHKINSYKSKVLKSIYQHEFRTYPNLYVQSVVVLTNPDATVEEGTSPKAAIEQRIHNPSFASILDFLNYLKKSSETGNKALSEHQVESIVKYLRSLNQPKRDVRYTVPGYETIEYITQKQDVIELIARPMEGKLNGLNRFRVFRPPFNAPELEKERFKKRAYNTARSVSQIGDHPNILKVWVFKTDEGDIVEGSEWSEAGTLRDLLSDTTQKNDSQKSLAVCKGIITALNTAHNVGVIHRNLRPENVLMFNSIAKLINFDLAYQIEDNRLTVISDAGSLKDDGYIAPEILYGQDIDESTDYFNLGIIMYELFTGQKPFSSTRSFVTQGGTLSRDALHKLENSDASEEVVSIIKQLIVAERNERLKDPQRILSGLGLSDQESESSSGNLELKPHERYDLFEIVEKIGEGGEAQIYKAKTLKVNVNSGLEEEKNVALKLFNKEVSRDKIFREYRITNAIQSAYTVRCENLGYWKNDRYFLVLDYLEGKPLRYYIENNIRPDYDVFLKVAFGLMDAIRALHNHQLDEETPKPYLHSDIKPDNIIILPDGKPVLIDFGIAGEPRIDSFQGTSDYIPPDSILGVDMKFSHDGDLYSLGVTLWEWLFGSQPYKNPVIGAVPKLPEDVHIDLPEHIKQWFLKAVATDASVRFMAIENMIEAFKPTVDEEESTETEKEELTEKEDTSKEEEKEDGKPVESGLHNEFVTYLNTLSNVSAGNENATAESQVSNEYFKRIAVGSSLTEYIFEILMSEKRNVILTGNAGDGKTTIATQIRQKLRNDPKALPAIEVLTEEKLVIVKDMSELDVQKRVDILSQSISDIENSYLIVSNTGTLLDSFNELNKHGFEVDQNTVLKALSSEKPEKILDDSYELINIGSINSIATACEVFKRMIAEDHWKKCSSCHLSNDCPMHFNLSLLQSKEDIVVNRIALIYRRLFEYNVRLTMRQMVGHLAYAITGGLTCAEIQAMSMIEINKSFSKFLFFNLFFGDDGAELSSIAMQLLPVRQVQKAGFGAFIDPLYEREAWTRSDLKVFRQENLSEDNIEKLSYLFKYNNSHSRRQVRRMLYFFGSLEGQKGLQFIAVFLRSPMLKKYIEFTQTTKKLPSSEERRYRFRILQVLQEFITGIRLPEGKWEKQADYLYITLNRAGFGSGTQMVLADFRLSEFELRVKTKYQVAHEKRNILTLVYKSNKNVFLELDLPFLDYVARRYEGEIAEELSSYYSDRLNKFKVRLLNTANNDVDDSRLSLLSFGADRAFKVIDLTFLNDKLEVIL
jgi:serine/threonine protein kinase